MTAADALFSYCVLAYAAVCIHVCVCVQPYHVITIVILEVMMQTPSQLCIIHTQ